MIMMNYEICCPYCGHTLSLNISGLDNDTAERIICDQCRKPLALYKQRAKALLHTERGVKAVSVEDAQFSDDSIYLEFIENEFAPTQKLQVPLGKSVLGRHNPKSTADIQVMTGDPSMDRNHSILFLDNKGWLSIMDNDSMTGTFVNGLELDPGERRRLTDGDVLTLGATSVIIHLPDEDEEWL